MKRGLGLFLLSGVVFGLFFTILLASNVFSGYCTNVCAVSYFCTDTSAVNCCPTDTNFYNRVENGISCPTNQSDCLANFADSPASECSIGCCLSTTNLQDSCQMTTSKIICEKSYHGTFASSCSLIPDCQEGCCCYKDNLNNASRVTYKAWCTAVSGDLFTPGSWSVENCSSNCTVFFNPGGPGTTTACNDTIDNDGDNLVDMADHGCRSTDDNSETDPNIECDDGVDNDRDGKADNQDTCCTSPTIASEEICDLIQCNRGPVGTKCACIDKVCELGKYCCDGVGCVDYMCGSQICTEGERQSCGLRQETPPYCELFHFCRSGRWETECRPDPMCGVQPEICDDDNDNNGDGAVDCLDISCAGVTCGTDPRRCESRGYYDTVSGYYKCCFTSNTNDCDNDGRMETCGSCDCLGLLLPPKLNTLKLTQGQQRIQLQWTLNCNVEAFVKRCVVTEDIDCTSEEQYSYRSTGLFTRTYDDVGIISGKTYCYLIEANYPTKKVVSNMMCTNSGDLYCLQMPPGEFCLDENLDTETTRVFRYKCDDKNKMVQLEDCRNRGSKYICMGPDSSGKTSCEYQSDCELCGRPLNMFAYLDGALALSIVYIPPGSSSGSNLLCKNVPTCYYDYSDTIKDKFSECSKVYSCYDYRSRDACEGDTTRQNGPNNKCLGRDCEWVSKKPEFNSGICMEKIVAYKQCEYCNIAEHNKIIDDCTVQRCIEFGQGSGGCYLNRNGECRDRREITCNDYLTQQECTNGQNVVIDAIYTGSTRVSGTNAVRTRSQDAAGFGLCRWDNNGNPKCFKDADGDTYPDPEPWDMTPPVTTVLTPNKVNTFYFTAVVFDADERGKPGTGLKVLWYKESDSPAYPVESKFPEEGSNKIIVTSGVGHGKHKVYFYAEDNANNLEVVRSFEVDVDKLPPQITILPWPQLSQSPPFSDSNITFEVIVDENATCNDYMEGVPDTERKIRNSFGDRFVVKYFGFSDGFYRYTVNCTDILGNVGTASILVKVEADMSITNPQPRDVINYSQVTLSVITDVDGVCKWDTSNLDYAQMGNTFSKQYLSSEAKYWHTFPYTLTESRSYSFYVKCNIGRISSDEIQFVYDVLSPVTTVVDTNNQPFNFSRWYAGLRDTVYLKCNDPPQFGFGCNKTLYCIADDRCTPNRESSPLFPLEYTLTPTSKTWVCYSSRENIKNDMGGLIEDVKCSQIMVDTLLPFLLNANIDDHSSSENALTTTETPFKIYGTVRDPDAQPGAGNNIVTITVTNGNFTRRYTDIQANDDFEQYVALALGLNTIVISVKDRSGATSEPRTFYIRLGQFTGQKIEMVEPTFGVGGSQNMNLLLRTYKEMQCVYAIDNLSYERSVPLTPSIEGGMYYHRGTFMHPSSTPERSWPLYVKCKDVDGVLYEQVFEVMWDNTAPVINNIYIDRGNQANPPVIADFPLETNLIVETSDPVRCKYSKGLETSSNSYNTGMVQFNYFPSPQHFNGTNPLKKSNTQFLAALQDKTTYDYFIECENGAGLHTPRQRFTFRVDTSLASGITLLYPPKLTSNTTFALKIKTNKASNNCRYGTKEDSINSAMTSNGTVHESQPLTFTEGKYTYYFRCVLAADVITEQFTFSVDTSPPTTPVIDDGDKSPSLSILSAKWSSNDSLSKVVEYNYSIGTEEGLTDVLNWTKTTKNSESVSGLKLKDGTTYYWAVIAKNELGMWSDVGYSDGVMTDISAIPSSNTTFVDLCNNEKVDVANGETDVDCGGENCLSCANGQKCKLNKDCASGKCTNGVCIAASCEDQIQNQGESDVDCGGVLCKKCELGKKCALHSDCASGFCGYDNTCKEASCDDGVLNGDEEDVDCGGSCPNPCPEIEECMVYENGQNLPDTDCDQMPDYWEEQYGLNVNLNDADEDPDGDGITNLQEYLNGTDPTQLDSSGSDFWLWVLLIVAVCTILGGGGYLTYVEYKKGKLNIPFLKKPTVRAGPSMLTPRQTYYAQQVRQPTLQQQVNQTISRLVKDRRQEERRKEREKLLARFDTFDEGKSSEAEKNNEKNKDIKGELDKEAEKKQAGKQIVGADEKTKESTKEIKDAQLKKEAQKQEETSSKKQVVNQASEEKKPAQKKSISQAKTKKTKSDKAKKAIEELSSIVKNEKKETKK
ncbi:MAG: hypothetical protein QXK37_02195 [Candidatus Woesearchaeota archaeon]